ncbi:hypothetical protein GCM10010238_19320 [Streptomyces griseoviridis]|uniref:DUF485 domain-containing protein n=2 Tax=Streptomyces griseoviridis TaxID=45398 RepID=A0A918GDV2_STRGD|nr:hypothetical protein GCM10010238_19320 [Streptomyces niveoruber]GGS82820.1 hypothetical protein GCM10010240_15300 [Streptomyces griseoviridis]
MSHDPYMPYHAPPSHPPRVPAYVPEDSHTLRLPSVRKRGDVRGLRAAYRRQRRTATFAALGYFLAFLLLAAFAPATLTGDVTAGLPLGMLLALLQLPVTWLAIALYEHTARRRVDPLVDRLRRDGAAGARGEAGR